MTPISHPTCGFREGPRFILKTPWECPSWIRVSLLFLDLKGRHARTTPILGVRLGFLLGLPPHWPGAKSWERVTNELSAMTGICPLLLRPHLFLYKHHGRKIVDFAKDR